MIPEIGIIEVAFSNPTFLTNVKQDTNIQSAGRELQAYLETDPDDKLNFTPGTPNGGKVTLDPTGGAQHSWITNSIVAAANDVLEG